MIFARAAALTAAAMLLSGAAFADETTVVNKPKWKGYGLDWCLTWATNCGKPVADKYCQSGGYDVSTTFNKWENPGFPTRLIGSNQVCDEEECDSFKSITCTKIGGSDDGDGAEEVTFKKPKAGGRRLDWCLTWATNCGKPAADYFCDAKGYDEAVDFKISEDIGKTRILKTGQKCTDPACDGFKYITCK